MNRVTVNPNVSLQLGEVSQPVQIFDEKGTLLGHFVPTSSLDPSATCPYTDEELAQMRTETGGRTLNDIWDSMSGK